MCVGGWGGGGGGGYTVFTLFIHMSVHYVLVSEQRVSNKHLTLTFFLFFIHDYRMPYLLNP